MREGIEVPEKAGEMLSPEAVRKHIERSGAACPYCDSSDILGDSFDHEGGEVHQRIVCMECGKSWFDVFRLVAAADEDGVVVMPADCSGQ